MPIKNPFPIDIKKLDRLDLVPVREAVHSLHKMYGFKMGYTGLMYYRNLGLIEAPQKIKGRKGRFYSLTYLFTRIQSIKAIADIFDLNFEGVAAIAKKIPGDIFDKLPGYFMKIYSDLEGDHRLSKREMIKKGGSDILSSPMFFTIMKGCFLGALENCSPMAGKMTAEDFYLKAIKKEVYSRLMNYCGCK
jgi:hypothetical protein